VAPAPTSGNWVWRGVKLNYGEEHEDERFVFNGRMDVVCFVRRMYVRRIGTV